VSPASLWKVLFGRRSRKASPDLREKVITWPNGLTFARAAFSTTVLVAAVIEQSHALLLAGLGISMAFDFADGQLARWRKAETIVGAQLDGVADRLATALAAAGIVSMNPEPLVVIAATTVWVQFGVLDQFLSSQFLRFGLWSSDHFHELEKPLGERVWRLNWSALAKLASNLPIVFLAVELWWAAIGLSVLLIAVRVPCYRSIRRLATEIPEIADSPEIPVPSFHPEPRINVERRPALPTTATLR